MGEWTFWTYILVDYRLDQTRPLSQGNPTQLLTRACMWPSIAAVAVAVAVAVGAVGPTAPECGSLGMAVVSAAVKVVVSAAVVVVVWEGVAAVAEPAKVVL